MKGEYVKDNRITEVTMVDEEPEGRVGDFGYKVEAKIKFNGQTDKDPDHISWNRTSAKLLKETFGDDSKNWLNKSIPIEAARTEKGYAIYVDEKEFAKKHGGLRGSD